MAALLIDKNKQIDRILTAELIDNIVDRNTERQVVKRPTFVRFQYRSLISAVSL